MVQTKPISYKKQTQTRDNIYLEEARAVSIKTANDAFINYRDTIQNESK